MSFNFWMNLLGSLALIGAWRAKPSWRPAVAGLWVASGVLSLTDLRAFAAAGNISGICTASFWIALGVGHARWLWLHWTRRPAPVTPTPATAKLPIARLVRLHADDAVVQSVRHDGDRVGVHLAGTFGGEAGDDDGFDTVEAASRTFIADVRLGGAACDDYLRACTRWAANRSPVAAEIVFYREQPGSTPYVSSISLSDGTVRQHVTQS